MSRLEPSDIEEMPEEYRVCVKMADIDGLAYKEIAEKLGVPLGSVMLRIYRGRKWLEARGVP